ncbi:hypothetical protein QOT17_004948 [Balamuthia mandrillaris]
MTFTCFIQQQEGGSSKEEGRKGVPPDATRDGPAMSTFRVASTTGEGRLPPPLPRTRTKSARIPVKRIGIAKIKHNAAERERKMLFNAKLEELRALIPELHSPASKRKVVEGAARLIQKLLSERQVQLQLIHSMDYALRQQQQPRGPFPCPPQPPPLPARKEVLPPIRYVLAQPASGGWPASLPPPSFSHRLV